jgi:hypothetical protein
MKVLWGYPGWGWQMFGLIGKENKWFFGLSRKEFLPKETEQQRRNRLEEVLSIHNVAVVIASNKIFSAVCFIFRSG